MTSLPSLTRNDVNVGESYEITEVSTGTQFECGASETILCAALRAGIGIPYECSVGGCGSCKVEVVAGEALNLRPDAPGLAARDRRKGKSLACQLMPRSACQVRFRANDAYRPVIPPRRIEASLVEIKPITHDISEFCFRSERPASFLPGQYAMIYLPGLDNHRPYSMSNVGNASGEWRFQIRHVPGGQASHILFEELGLGDVICLDAPYSTAHLVAGCERDIVLIAGGSGLSPMVSIMHGIAADPSMDNLSVTLFYGGRTPKDVPDSSLFSDLPEYGERFRFLPAISDFEADGGHWDGPVGYIHDIVAQVVVKQFSEFEYYMAGPPPMIDAVRKMLVLEHGVPVNQLHYDRFF